LKVLLNWFAAFCAAETQFEKKEPLPAEGDDKVPPGVFVSSRVGVKGELVTAFDNLLAAGPDDFGRERKPRPPVLGGLPERLKARRGVVDFLGGEAS